MIGPPPSPPLFPNPPLSRSHLPGDLAARDPMVKRFLFLGGSRPFSPKIVINLPHPPRQFIVGRIVRLGLTKRNQRLPHLRQIRPPCVELVCFGNRLGGRPSGAPHLRL